MGEELPIVLFLLAGIGLVTPVDPIEISGQLGSDLHLPVADACQSQGSYFDIYISTQKIGTYDIDLTPFNGYKDRLTYNKTTCDITLKNLTDQDGTSFRVTLMKIINSKIESHDINYRINISGPLTSPPYTEHTIHPPAGETIFLSIFIPIVIGVLATIGFCCYKNKHKFSQVSTDEAKTPPGAPKAIV